MIPRLRICDFWAWRSGIPNGAPGIRSRRRSAACDLPEQNPPRLDTGRSESVDPSPGVLVEACTDSLLALCVHEEHEPAPIADGPAQNDEPVLARASMKVACSGQACCSRIDRSESHEGPGWRTTAKYIAPTS